jgi:hypothetical protein
MIAELYTETKTGYQVHNKDCIHFNRIGAENLVKHPHSSQKLEKHKEYTHTNDYGNAQTAQNLE